jgi:chemotaxis signal transduction protein
MQAVAAPSQNSFVLLQIGRRRFGLSAGEVTELAPPVKLHSFPHTSSMLLGVIVRRGRIVPVYDVASVLDVATSSTQRFYLIARRPIGKPSELCAIPVDGECELAFAEVTAPAEDHPPYVAGSIVVGEESVEVLNLPALLEFNPALPSSVSHGAEAQ